MAFPSAWTIETGVATYSGTGYVFSGGFRWRIMSQDLLTATSVLEIQLWAARNGPNGLTNSNLRTSFVEYDNNPSTRQNISTSFNFLAANTVLNTKYYCGTDNAQFNGNSIQITVAHNSDGSRTVPIHTYHLANMTNWMSVETSVNIILDTIPRATMLSSFNDFQIETTAGAIAGNANVYSATFYHRFKLFQGSTEVASWDIGQLAVGAYAYALSLTATQRNAIFAAMPTIDNQVFTLQLITYSDAARTVQIGSTQTKTGTGTIPSSYKPVITTANSNFSWTNKNSKLTSYLIQNISTLTLLLSGGGAPTGATLANYQVRYGSILRSGAYTGAAISENVGLIAESGTLYAYFSVQDSRGRWSAEISEQLLGNALGVQAYNPPLNNGFDIRRNTSTPTSADYILKFANSLYSLGNTWTYTLYYWNVSTWTVAKSATAITAATIDAIYTHALPYSESSVYDVKVVLTDQFNTAEYIDTMPTSEFPASFGKKGMGVGKDTSDTYNLEVGLLGLSSDGPIVSKVLAGTAPFAIQSTTLVPNLNADMLGTKHASDFVLGTTYTASDILAKLKTLDGTGSGLDADLLRGMNAEANAVVNSVVIRDGAGNIRGTTFIGDRFQTYYGEFGIANNTWTPAVWLPTNGARPSTYLVCAGLAAVQDSDNWSICAIITADATHGKILSVSVANSLCQLRCVASALQLIQQSGGSQIGFVSYTRIL